MSSVSIRSFVLMIESLCSFEAYGVDSKYPGMNATKVITIESVPISEYWFRRIFMGTHRRESLYRQIDPPTYYGNSKIMPVEFRKNDVMWRLESAYAGVHDLLRVRLRRSVRCDE